MIYPLQYEHLWRLAVAGPLAASELADDANRGGTNFFTCTGSSVANQLRILIKLGLIEHDGGRPAIYRLTPAGRAFVEGDVTWAADLLRANR